MHENGVRSKCMTTLTADAHEARIHNLPKDLVMEATVGPATSLKT